MAMLKGGTHMKSRISGFTLTEIMTVVLVLGILLALAIPNFVKYRANAQANACRVNMRSIMAAVEEARLERASFIKTAVDDDGVVDIDDLVGGSFLRETLKCPVDDSEYTISFSGGNCTVVCGSGKEDHVLTSY